MNTAPASDLGLHYWHRADISVSSLKMLSWFLVPNQTSDQVAAYLNQQIAAVLQDNMDTKKVYRVLHSTQHIHYMLQDQEKWLKLKWIVMVSQSWDVLFT